MTKVCFSLWMVDAIKKAEVLSFEIIKETYKFVFNFQCNIQFQFTHKHQKAVSRVKITAFGVDSMK